MDSIAPYISFISQPIGVFERRWPAKTFHYQTLSTIAFVAVCDFQKRSMVKHRNGGPNTCGKTCLLLKEAFDDTEPDFVAVYSKSDHINMVSLTSYSDIITHKTSGATHSANIFMSFRGTYAWDVVNHRRNSQHAMLPITLCDGCAAKNGDYKSFVAVRYGAFTAYRTAERKLVAQSKYPTLMMVGMSMGSNLAVFCGIYFRVVMSKDVKGVYTLGGTRTGNSVLNRFSKNLGETVNFVMYRDPVPHLSPRIFGYRHFASDIMLLYYDPLYYALQQSGGEPEYDRYLYYEPFVGNDADSRLATAVRFYSIADHSQYFAGVEEISMASCGGFADHYMQNIKGTALFL